MQESKGQSVEISGEYRHAVEERRREFKAFEADFKVILHLLSFTTCINNLITDEGNIFQFVPFNVCLLWS